MKGADKTMRGRIRFEKRPATTTKPPSLQHRLVYLDSLDIPAGVVVEAVRSLLG